mmetsp:Transcript_14697/g.55621  ORF Transcript_14697/g.55621 Transcript_14697/m.55621 type:complete len:105 (+) Transcript_14697:3548-3862(+)
MANERSGQELSRKRPYPGGWELSAYHEKKSTAQKLKLKEIEEGLGKTNNTGHDRRLRYTCERDCHYLPQVECLTTAVETLWKASCVRSSCTGPRGLCGEIQAGR